MRAAINAESDALAIRRPLRPCDLAANIGQRSRCCAGWAIYGSDPKLMFRFPNGVLAVGRDLDILAAFFLTTHVAQQPRLAFIHVGCPNLLLWLRRQAERICRSSASIQLRTPGVEDYSTIGSHLQRRDPLTIVSGVARDLASQEVRSRRDPNVVSAFVVENPSDDLSVLSCVELRRKRPAHNLLDSKRLSKAADGSEQQEEGGKFERSQVISEYQRFRNLA